MEARARSALADAKLTSSMILLFQSQLVGDAVEGTGQLFAQGLGAATDFRGDFRPLAPFRTPVRQAALVVGQPAPHRRCVALDQLGGSRVVTGADTANQVEEVMIFIHEAPSVAGRPDRPSLL